MKQGFGKLASLKEAKEIIFNLVREKDNEMVDIGDSLNRVLAEDIVAEIDVPHFNKSAMDGFAVRAEDTFNASNTNPKKLKIIDSVTAGLIPKKELDENECTEITTGAILPKNADSVLMVEYTEREGNNIRCHKAVAPGENVIKIGSDIKKGTKVLNKGIVLMPRHVGVISSLGIKEILVKKIPRIAYFSTGNEILNLNEELSDGKVFDINSYTIINAIKEHGCAPINLGIAKDAKEDIKNKINEGIEKAELVLMSGGSSLGGEDFIVGTVKELGEILVHGIAVKPGKPVLIATIKNKLVLGLPGYPTSALSNFYILITPIIHKMLGIKEKKNFIKAKLSRKIVSTIGRYEFMAVKLVNDTAIPIMKGSSAITTMAEADGFIEIEENSEVLEKGCLVRVRLF